jgi:hypothetical protein
MTENDDILKGIVKYGLRIQHRFKPEPLYATTGVGYLKSEGVTTLQKVKRSLAKRAANKNSRSHATHES